MSFILLGILNSQIDAAGGGSYDLLETQILTSAASSVTFTGLGSYSDYKHLQVRYVARNSFAGTGSGGISLRLNSDTGSNYSYHQLSGNGASVTGFGLASQTANELGRVPSNNDTSGSFGAGVIDILDFSSTTKNTTIRCLSGAVPAADPKQVALFGGGYFNTSAITATEIFVAGQNLVAGSRFSLYGVKA